MVTLLRKRPSELLNAHRDEVIEIAARHGGSNILVFGSVARGDDTPDSDIDLIVSFEPGTLGLAGLIALEDELAEALGVDVDVVSAGSERIEAVRRHSVAL